MHFMPPGPTSWYNLPRDKGVAYAAQESWVQNETIRDNILFGQPYDQVRYRKGGVIKCARLRSTSSSFTLIELIVLSQCALEPDLKLFDAGDQTEVCPFILAGLIKDHLKSLLRKGWRERHDAQVDIQLMIVMVFYDA